MELLSEECLVNFKDCALILSLFKNLYNNRITPFYLIGYIYLYTSIAWTGRCTTESIKWLKNEKTIKWMRSPIEAMGR